MSASAPGRGRERIEDFSVGFEELIVVVDVRYLVVGDVYLETREIKGEKRKRSKVGMKAGRRKQTGNIASLKKLGEKRKT